MTRDDTSDPPIASAQIEPGVLSGLFPRAPTLPELFTAQRKLAGQMVGLLEANRDAVNRDRDQKRLIKALEENFKEIRRALDEINKSFTEYKLAGLAEDKKEAVAKGVLNFKVALLMAAAGVVSAGLVGLLFHFLGHTTP
jgi:hypothetical protein